MLTIRSTAAFHNGGTIPRLGLGTYHSANGGETYRAVRVALDAGYRHIDTAAYYGNESDVGRAVRDSRIAREDIFVTTKMWNDAQREGRQREALEDSLRSLGLDYVDLYLLHWPVPQVYRRSWEMMQDFATGDAVRNIGVCNCRTAHLVDLLSDGGAIPVINQMEHHPLMQDTQTIEFCRANSVLYQAWSPLGRGEDLGESTLLYIARAHGKSVAQVVIRWHLQSGMVVIPKSVHEERIIENADVFDFELTAAEMDHIFAMDERRYVHSYATPDTFEF